MNRVLVADAITMINDKWIEEAAFYSAPAKSKRKRMNIGVKILIAAVLLLSAITVAGAAGILPGGYSLNELFPFTGYSKWHDNYTYKTTTPQQAVITEDVVLKDNYTFTYSYQEKTGDCLYHDLAWTSLEALKLKKGDIVDVVYYGDEYSTVCLWAKGTYQEAFTGTQKVPYGIVKTQVLDFSRNALQSGNQAVQYLQPADGADNRKEGVYRVKLYDKPNGSIVEKDMTGYVEVLQRDNGWAQIQSWNNENETGWCEEEQLQVPGGYWCIFNPQRSAEDDNIRNVSKIQSQLDKSIKSGREQNLSEIFMKSPNAFLQAMNSYDENNQITIARQLAEDLKEGDKEKAQTIVSLLYESAIDKTTQGTISVIKNEIKE